MKRYKNESLESLNLSIIFLFPAILASLGAYSMYYTNTKESLPYGSALLAFGFICVTVFFFIRSIIYRKKYEKRMK